MGKLSGITTVSAGKGFALALLENGTVVSWGENTSGQLGDGTFTGPEQCSVGETKIPCSKNPVEVSGLKEVAAISAGNESSLALLKNGTVVAWGRNNQGQLGTGTTENSDVPVPVSGLTGVTAISSGSSSSLALLSNGNVMAWGGNSFGHQCTGTESGSHVPVEVTLRSARRGPHLSTAPRRRAVL